MSITPSAIRRWQSSGVQTPDQALRFVPVAEDPWCVGQEDELVGLERLRDGGGGGIGVDVQERAIGRVGVGVVQFLGKRREDRNDPCQAEVLDRRRIDLGHLADPAQVDRSAVAVGKRQTPAE